MSSKTNTNKIEKSRKVKRSQERDKSPCVSDIRKIFQAKASTTEKTEKIDKQKAKNKVKDMQKSGNPSGGTVTRQQKKASSDMANTPSKTTATNDIDKDDNNHDEVFEADSGETEISFKGPSGKSNNECDNQENNLTSSQNAGETSADNETPLTDELNEKNNQANNKAVHFKSIATQTNHDEVQLKMKHDIEELTKKVNRIDESIFDPKNGVEVQLAKNIQKVVDIHSEIHGATGGLKVKLDQLQEKMSSTNTKMQELESANKALTQLLQDSQRLAHDLTIMQGIMQKHNQQLGESENKMLDLTRRGMEQNLLIHGVEDPEDEIDGESVTAKCKRAVADFLYNNLDLVIAKEDIWKAHRVGRFIENKARPMVVKLAYHAKESVMENLGQLKGKKNKYEQVLFISEQIPEGISEIKKQVNSRVSSLKAENESKPKENRSTIRIVNDKILVDGQIDIPEVTTPQPADLFPCQAEQNEINQLNSKIVETEPISVAGSNFIGLAVKVHSITEVNRAYKAAVQRFSAMDHVMLSYALKDETGKLKFGSCDDREYGGSAAIRKTMQAVKPKNTAVFVVRKYGGLHLGFSRFKTIEQAAAEAMRLLEA